MRLSLFICLCFLTIAPLVLPAQQQHYVVMSYDMRYIGPKGAFGANVSAEVVLSKHLSVALSVGPGFGFRYDSAEYEDNGFSHTAWLDGSFFGVFANPHARIYLAGEDGAPDGLYVGAGLISIIGTEKNEVTYYDSPDRIHVESKKKGTLFGPHIGLGYQFGKEISIMTVGLYANCAYLSTGQSYDEPIFKDFGFQGIYESRLRIDGGFTVGVLLNRG